MKIPTIPPVVATIVGTLITVLSVVAHVSGGFLPGQDVSYLTGAVGVLTWISVHILHKAVVASAVRKAKAAKPPVV